MDRLERSVRRELGRFGPAEGIAPILEAWPSAVGAAIAAIAWPARLSRDGTLHVHAKDSVWAFELTQRAAEIRTRLGEAAPARLRFAVGPVIEPTSEPAAEALRMVPLPGPAERARAAELAAEIADEELRASVERAAALSLASTAAGRGF
jgi:hypothetical protein